MATILFLALKDLAHDRRRAVLNVIALAAVVFVYLILTALSQTLGALGQEADISNNLIVVEGDMIDPSDATLDPAAVQAAEDLIPDFIGRISPTIFRHLRLNDRMIQLRAADQSSWRDIHHISLVEGSWPRNSNEIVISDGAAAVGNWDTGDSVTIYGRRLEVVGVVQFEGMAFATIFMNLTTAEELFGLDRGYQFMLIEVTPGVDADLARTQLQADPRINYRYDVFFEDDYTMRNARALSDIQATASALSVIALLAAVLGVYNATGLSLVERQRQIGILRAIGFMPGTARWLLLFQALLQALVGFVVGLAGVLSFVYFQGNSEQLYAFGWPLRFVVTPGMVLLGLVLVLVLAGVGALLATRTLLVMSPAEAIHAS